MGARVMHRILKLVSRFGRDERGAFAVVFGLMAIVLIAMGGATVDYVSLQQARSKAQIALDAAALALQPEIFNAATSKEQIRDMAQALMVERIGSEWGVVADIKLEDVLIDREAGSLYLKAHMAMPTTFVSLVGVKQLSADVQSEAMRRRLALEVVMVLDNSGSMKDESRMVYLKDAARCATYTLMYSAVVDKPGNANTCIPAPGATLVENVSIGIVPFTMFVNVGSGNANATWIDSAGASVTSNDNFDDDDNDATPMTMPVKRFDLFAKTGVAWRGCVEARPHIKMGTESTEYLDTDDSPPISANALFVPMFSPDVADTYGGGQNYMADQPAVCNYPSTCSRTATQTSCNAAYTSCSASSGAWSFTGPNKGSLTCSCNSPTVTTWQNKGTGTGRYRERNESCSFSYAAQGLSTRELQERICKYSGTVNSNSFSNGPNADCTREPILPLTTNVAEVLATIEDMVAEGGTNIHEGTAWGYRTLSPGQPFTQGAAYSNATAKIMIVMTDGENTAYNLTAAPNYHCGTTQASANGSCYNSAYGYPYNSRNNNPNSSSTGDVERLGPRLSANGSVTSVNSELVDHMNQRTSQTCANAKRPLAAGQPDKIRIFTIGLATAKVSQSTPAVVQQMLRDCATSPADAHLPASPAALKSVFQSIANQLAALRLSI